MMMLDVRLSAIERLVGLPPLPADTTGWSVHEPSARVEQRLAALLVRMQQLEASMPNLARAASACRALGLDDAQGIEAATLSVHAKADIVIAAEASLLETAAQLRQLDALQQFINPPNLEQVPALIEPLHKLSYAHMEHKELTEHLNLRLDRLLRSYNDVVCVRCSLLAARCSTLISSHRLPCACACACACACV